jgi:hypothetical protein
MMIILYAQMLTQKSSYLIRKNAMYITTFIYIYYLDNIYFALVDLKVQ